MDLDMAVECASPLGFDAGLPQSVINKELSHVFPQGSDVLHVLFSPFLSHLQKGQVKILSCPLEKFKRRFKITSDILNPMIELWDSGHVFTLAGGKMIDFFMNKSLAESTNDYDCFSVSTAGPLTLFERLSGRDDYIECTNLTYLYEIVSNSLNKYHPIKLQAVTCVYANQENIIENFDIRACAIACDGKTVYWVKGCLQDIKKKVIVSLSPSVGKMALTRILKYVKKGFEIAIPDLAIASIKFLDSLHRDPYAPYLYDREYAEDRTRQTQEYENEDL